MKHEIRNMSGEVIYVAEIDCDANKLPSVLLGEAVKAAARDGANLTGAYLADANLAGADLAGANLRRAGLTGAYLARANLHGANLAGADLDGANLTHANLHGANLARADLVGANLTHANLHGANLARADLVGANGVLDGGQRSDGYRFVAVRHDNGPRIAAGCRWSTLAEARKHWTQTRGGTPLGDETLARLDMLERAARAHGWPMGDEAQEAA